MKQLEKIVERYNQHEPEWREEIETVKNLPEIKSGEINGEESLSLAAKYDVFSLPIFLLFIEGKETLRIGRNVDLLELERNIKRYYEMIF